MTEIHLENTLPKVFAERTDIESDVWKKPLTLKKGENYLIEAASGTGKTSLCSFLMGQRKDYLGIIRFDNSDLSKLKISDWTKIRRHHLSCIFQEMRIFSELSAWDNVIIKNNLTNHKTEAEISDWFDMLGLKEKKEQLAGKMSQGQQQRVALMRSLVQPFDFLIADEPVSHLDDENSRIMAEIIMEEAKKNGAGLVVTSIGKRMPLNYDKILKL